MLFDMLETSLVTSSQAGATTAELMARMGHSSPRAALIYQHATTEHDHAIASRLDEMIGEAKATPSHQSCSFRARARDSRSRLLRAHPHACREGRTPRGLPSRPSTGNLLERATGIELAFSAWEADVLPLNYARGTAPRLAEHAAVPGGAVEYSPCLGPRRRRTSLLNHGSMTWPLVPGNGMVQVIGSAPATGARQLDGCARSQASTN